MLQKYKDKYVLDLDSIGQRIIRDMAAAPNLSIKYLVISGKVVTLTKKYPDGFWYDDRNTIWALPELTEGQDKIVRCGVGIFSFSTKNPLTAFCGVHDYMYSSPVYQVFHTRHEADLWLYRAVAKAPNIWKYLALPMYYLTRTFGGLFWENEDTKRRLRSKLLSAKSEIEEQHLKLQNIRRMVIRDESRKRESGQDTEKISKERQSCCQEIWNEDGWVS